MSVSGPDVSRHQGTVDWGKVKAAGHSFAIIKATEGTAYTWVGWFELNWPKVKAAGLTPGAYHFLRNGNGAAQARYFIDTVGSFDGAIAVVDVEKASNGSWPTIFDVRAFVTEFRRLVPGHPIVVYTGGWFWKDYLKNTTGADLGPLWHSEYESTPAEIADGPEGDVYGGWEGATLWQYTSSGSCPGVSGNCDLNKLLRGTLADLTGQEDDVTRDELVDAIRDTLNAEAKKVYGIVSWERYLEVLLQTARGANVDEEAIARAVVAALPAGSVDATVVTEAVKAALRAGTG